MANPLIPDPVIIAPDINPTADVSATQRGAPVERTRKGSQWVEVPPSADSRSIEQRLTAVELGQITLRVAIVEGDQDLRREMRAGFSKLNKDLKLKSRVGSLLAGGGGGIGLLEVAKVILDLLGK